MIALFRELFERPSYYPSSSRKRTDQFRIHYMLSVLYYPSSENKDADQLRGYREADLRLCFRPVCRLLVFPCGGASVIKGHPARSKKSHYTCTYI